MILPKSVCNLSYVLKRGLRDSNWKRSVDKCRLVAGCWRDSLPRILQRSVDVGHLGSLSLSCTCNHPLRFSTGLTHAQQRSSAQPDSSSPVSQVTWEPEAHPVFYCLACPAPYRETHVRQSVQCASPQALPFCYTKLSLLASDPHRLFLASIKQGPGLCRAIRRRCIRFLDRH